MFFFNKFNKIDLSSCFCAATTISLVPVWALSQIFNFANLRNLVPMGRAYYYTGGLTKKMLITIIIIVVQVKAILVNIFGGIVNCATIEWYHCCL